MIFGPKAPSNETDEAPTGFWNGETLESRLKGLIDPFVKEAIDCAAYTLKMGAEVYVSPNEESPNPQSVTIRTLAENEAFTIPPGQFAFLLTEEIVTVPADALAFISIKAKVKWRGLINVSGFHVDPGFKGRLIFSVFNAGPVPVHLRRGQDLFLIWYASLDNPTKELREKLIQEHIPAELISGIAGEVQSLAGLSKKISAVEKDLVDRVHKIEKEQTRYRIYAGIVGGIIAAIFTVWLRDSFFTPKPSVVPAAIPFVAAPVLPQQVPPLAPASPAFPAPKPALPPSGPAVSPNPVAPPASNLEPKKPG